MCSILAILDIPAGAESLRDQALEMSRRLRHRGPDWSGIHLDEHAILAHERLAIVDLLHGAQPLYSPDKRFVLAVNGEIYNHRELRARFPEYAFQTDSDCEVIIPLLEAEGIDGLKRLNGIFAFVLWDSSAERFLVVRDPVGVIPLYYGHDAEGHLMVASELKALEGVCNRFQEFLPGHVLDSNTGREPQKWAGWDWDTFEAVQNGPSDPTLVRKALSDAVHRQLMGDVPYGVLLSGGLDSSVIAALAAQFAESRVDDGDQSKAWWPRLHSFAIGLEGSPDLAAARAVADHIGTVHHGFTFTVREGIDALRDVIHHIETYDVTTIRASTPMFLMARRIKAMGIKMVLSGEGSDEIFGGYLYFHKAPNAREFHEETVRKISRLHLFDCLRANKSMAAWGIEARVPFLDLAFLDAAMHLDPEAKTIRPGMLEKQILRDAFADLLPEAIIKRQKEQFSDGVGYGWIDHLKAHAAERVTDLDMERAAFRFPVNTPDTKEGYYYRSIFEELFPSESAARCVVGGKSVACSTPEALAWDASFASMADPSGRAVKGVHTDAY
ncbi:MAG: asparagine synthase B [Bacteroidetes bacterium]|nr:asparagine synthase B [Bacteroidota bacterium]MDA0874817.1 asparagine synthase B [Bacteroidota bacterium]